MSAIAATSLWLGVLAGLVGLALTGLAPRLGPVGRYRMWYAALLLTLLGPLTAWVAARPDRHPSIQSAAEAGISAGGPALALPPIAAAEPPAAPNGDETPSSSWGWQMQLPAEAVRAANWIWLLGILAGLASLGLEAVRLIRLRRRARPPSSDLLAIWRLAVAAVPTGRRLRLLESDRLAMPMACGWLRPAVVVPSELDEILSPEEVQQLLMHELAHLARRDDWHLVIQHLIRACYWWHPMVRWMTGRLELERELACDQVVAGRSNRRAYARTLVRMAGLTLVQSSRLAAAASRGRLSERVEVLLRDAAAVTLTWRRAGAGLALGSVAASALWVGPPSVRLAVPPAAAEPAAPVISNGAIGAELDQRFRRFADSGFSGTVLVARGDQIVLEQGYGMADRERGIPATTATRYSTAGITKLFTAAAILTLEQEGRLRVQDSLARWTGALPDPKNGVTLHHLLTHTDGLTRLQAPVYRGSAERFVEAVGATVPAFSPGSGYRYNDFGHSLLGLVVERASGEQYEEFVRRRFLQPAGLISTGFESDGGPIAVEYAGTADAPEPIGRRAYTWGRRGSLGLVSTAGDLYRWFQAMQNPAILDPAIRLRMVTPTVMTDWGAEQAYGWDLQPRPDGRRIWRRVAGTPGFEGEILHDPVAGWTAIILVNSRLGWRFRVWQAIERAMLLYRPIR